MIATYEYTDKIYLMNFHAEGKLKEKKYTVPFTNNDSQPTNGNKFVKLLKLNIQKFYGGCTQFIKFWNKFKVSIHYNNSLTK